MNVATVAPGAETPKALANSEQEFTFAKVKAFAKKLGETSAKGDDALPLLAMTVTKAARAGALSSEKKHKSRIPNDKGELKKLDDVGSIFEEYVIEHGNKSLHKRSSNSVTSHTSRLRQFFNLGILVHVNGEQVMDRALKVYQATNPKHQDPNSLGAYEYYQKVAKAQLKTPETPLSPEELQALIWKPEPKDKELLKELNNILDRINMIRKGEGSFKDIQDDSAELSAAYDLIQQRVDQIEKAQKIAKLREQALELGIAL